MICFTRLGDHGRLGNQIFQFASSLGISNKLGLDFKIIDKPCELRECFEIPNNFIISSDHLPNLTVYFSKNSVIDGDVGFDENALKISDNTDLFGYFQCAKYFQHLRKDLLQILQFKSEWNNLADDIWQNIEKRRNNNSVVSVHVRRGDYLDSPYHPVSSLDYYQQAFNLFSDSLFVIFSDDIDWCRANFTGDNIIISSCNNNYVDLKLMTMCDHHIIANSSFSWWGAWLNTSNGKVVAPSKWFENPNSGFQRFDDIYCDDWIII